MGHWTKTILRFSSKLCSLLSVITLIKKEKKKKKKKKKKVQEPVTYELYVSVIFAISTE
jgi:hypothetical protein